MDIELAPKVALMLETAAAQTDGMEFSGFGFVERRSNGLYIYDAVILNVGSRGYTEIPAEKTFELTNREDRQNMKCWLH